jgi:hypothetical protein
MTRYWNQLEAVSLAGRHWLKQCLTSTPEDAWYLTRYDVNTDAAVRVMPANTHGAEEQLALWRSAMDFDQPHLVRMLDAGRTEAEGADLIYAVCEYPDDFVQGVLAERPLSPGEAREVLNASLAALGFLHEKGLVHGAVDAAHIMAFGDTIKLPSDTIRHATGGISPADDMWSLGATLHEILTQQRPEPDSEPDFSQLPEPFATIVRNTLQANRADRWSVEDIERHLNPPPARAVEPPPATEPTAASAPERHNVIPIAGPAAAAAAPLAPPVDAPVEHAKAPQPEPIHLPPPYRRETAPVERGFPVKWIPVAGLVAAVGLSVVVFRKPEHLMAPAVVQTASPAPSAGRVATAPPPAAKVTAPAHVVPPAPAGSSNASAIWRVVVYTYNSHDAAEKKVRSINEKRSAWHAEVFAPRGNRAPYYVSLGGRMTLPQAERLQKEARAKGMPRDTFVRNFSN